MATTLTVAERRVDELQAALVLLVRAKKQLEEVVAEELKQVEETIEQASEAIYNATIYDPEGERRDDV